MAAGSCASRAQACCDRFTTAYLAPEHVAGLWHIVGQAQGLCAAHGLTTTGDTHAPEPHRPRHHPDEPALIAAGAHRALALLLILLPAAACSARRPPRRRPADPATQFRPPVTSAPAGASIVRRGDPTRQPARSRRPPARWPTGATPPRTCTRSMPSASTGQAAAHALRHRVLEVDDRQRPGERHQLAPRPRMRPR